jgi:hypothetical protein
MKLINNIIILLFVLLNGLGITHPSNATHDSSFSFSKERKISVSNFTDTKQLSSVDRKNDDDYLPKNRISPSSSKELIAEEICYANPKILFDPSDYLDCQDNSYWGLKIEILASRSHPPSYLFVGL